MNISFRSIAGAFFFLCLGAHAAEQQILQDTNPPAPARTDIWRDGIGSGFNAGTRSLGLMAGAGPGTAVLGTSLHHNLALANLNAAWIFPESFPGVWLAGSLELRGELFGGAQFSPRDRYLTGLTAMLRYDFATGSRWVPFLDAGAGVSGTDIDSPDLGEDFNFNLQGGFGTYFFIRKNLALSAEYRWLHFSDAGITHLNHGINAQMFEGGVTWFF